MTFMRSNFHRLATWLTLLLCVLHAHCEASVAAGADAALTLSTAYATELSTNPLNGSVPDSAFTHMPEQQVSLGFLDKPVWIKLRVHAPRPQDEIVFLVVTPPRHEKLTLYQVTEEARTTSAIESLPSSETVNVFAESQKNVFMLRPRKIDNDYFLKIEPFGPMNIQLHLKRSEQLETDFHNKVFSLGGAVFSTVVFIFLTSFLFLINKEKIYLLFFAHVLASVMVFISTLGFGITFLSYWFKWDLNLQLGMFMILNITSGFLLFSHILRLMTLPSWVYRYTYLMPVVNLFFLIWFIASHSQTAWLVSTLFGIGACLLYGYAFLTFFDKKISAQWVLAIFSSVIFLLLMLLMLGLLGSLPFSSQVMQPNVLRIGSLPVIFGLIFWFYEVVKRDKLSAIDIQKATESRSFEEEIKRRKTYEGFMGMLVHEIKTPLSIIQIASISLGRRFMKDSNEALRIAHIDKAVNDINDILGKCVQVSDIENNTVFVDKTLVDLDELMAELQGVFKSPQIIWKVAGGLQIFTDYILLRTILSNLISNALKYADPKQSIDLTCEAQTGAGVESVDLTVTNAIGNAGTPDPDHVFERYYRGSLTSGQPGTGLGLWLSQQIAKVLETEIVMRLADNKVQFQLSFKPTP